MQNTIYLSEVLKEMRKMENATTPAPFHIAGRTFSAQNKTGGKIFFYKNATLMQAPKQKGANRLADKTVFRNPQHYTNRTRNLKTDQGERKINILFITHFNGMEVIF